MFRQKVKTPGTSVADAKVQQSTLSVRIIRADGTVEDCGVVAFYHRNPLRRLQWRVKQFVSRIAEKLKG